MRKEGDRLIIEPAPRKSLVAVLATLKPLGKDFPPIPDSPPDAVPEPEILGIIGEESKRKKTNKLSAGQIDRVIKAARKSKRR
jgi:hypothetical protein